MDLSPSSPTFGSLVWGCAQQDLPLQLHAPFAPEPVPDAELIAVSPDAARLIGIEHIDRCDEALRMVASGAAIPKGTAPVALAYSGHQFGSYVPHLGDGRACLLGDVGGVGDARWELQLKGSGPTTFSRGFDGRAVLRSTLREYLASEAMAGLGIATTRALAVAHSPLSVYREEVESAAVLVRMARTHLRFGSFQYLAQSGDQTALARLADLVIDRYMIDVDAGDYAGLLQAVSLRTAELLADWQAVGFAHGVMNTDNMSIIGDTLDYGPYAFLDTFDPSFTPNTTDIGGRYAFGRQPAVALWNLGRLADAMSALVEPQNAQAVLNDYADCFTRVFTARMRAKLGLETAEPGDEELITALLDALAHARADYAAFFRLLGDFATDDRNAADAVCAVADDERPLRAWLPRYSDRLGSSDVAGRRERMARSNPLYLPKNWIAEHVIARATQQDYGEVDRLRAAFADPYRAHEGLDAFTVLAPTFERDTRLGCSS